MNRQELIAQIKEKQSFLCVGLDPDLNKIPQACRDYIRSKVSDDNSYISSTLLSFCAIIADKTAPYCVAYKPNLAFSAWPTSLTLHSTRLTASTA